MPTWTTISSYKQGISRGNRRANVSSGRCSCVRVVHTRFFSYRPSMAFIASHAAVGRPLDRAFPRTDASLRDELRSAVERLEVLRMEIARAEVQREQLHHVKTSPVRLRRSPPPLTDVESQRVALQQALVREEEHASVLSARQQELAYRATEAVRDADAQQSRDACELGRLRDLRAHLQMRLSYVQSEVDAATTAATDRDPLEVLARCDAMVGDEGLGTSGETITRHWSSSDDARHWDENVSGTFLLRALGDKRAQLQGLERESVILAAERSAWDEQWHAATHSVLSQELEESRAELRRKREVLAAEVQHQREVNAAMRLELVHLGAQVCHSASVFEAACGAALSGDDREARVLGGGAAFTWKHRYMDQLDALRSRIAKTRDETKTFRRKRQAVVLRVSSTVPSRITSTQSYRTELVAATKAQLAERIAEYERLMAQFLEVQARLDAARRERETMTTRESAVQAQVEDLKRGTAHLSTLLHQFVGATTGLVTSPLS